MLDTIVRISLVYLIKYIPENCIEFSIIRNFKKSIKRQTEPLQNNRHFGLKENEPAYSLSLLSIILPCQSLTAICHWQHLAQKSVSHTSCRSDCAHAYTDMCGHVSLTHTEIQVI